MGGSRYRPRDRRTRFAIRWRIVLGCALLVLGINRQVPAEDLLNRSVDRVFNGTEPGIFDGIALIAGAEPAEPAAASPKAADLGLDALLDIADKAPEKLHSIEVKPQQRGVGVSPEMVFTPTESQSSSASSIGDLLSKAPGVISRSTSSFNQDARIRGYSGSQVVGVADGMNQVKTRLDIDSLFSQIDPNLVESITVIAGPYSVEHGPGFAFFDAQLITPKRTDQMALDSKTQVGYNTNGQQLMWRETGSFSDKTSGAIISIGQRMGSDYRAGNSSTDYHVPAAYHLQDVYAAVSGDVTARSRLDASFLYQGIQDTELPGVAYDINHQTTNQVNLRWTWRDDSTNADRFQGQFWWSEARFNANASRPSKQQTFVDVLLGQPYPNDLGGGGTVVGNGGAVNLGARGLAFFGDPEMWQIRSGVDWRHVRQVYREQDFDANGNQSLLGDTFGIPESTSDDFGIFAGGNLVVNERLTLGAGQRFDVVQFGLNSTDLVDTTTQDSPNGVYVPGFSTPTRFNDMTYLTGKFQATEATTINTGISFAMRPPNMTELYSDQPFAPLVRFGNSFAFGNSNLESEKNLQLDLGFTTRVEKSSFGARAYYSIIRDYIGLASNSYGSFPTVGSAPPGQLGRALPYMADPTIPNQLISADSASLGYNYRNISLVTLTGFDLTGDQQTLPWLEFNETMNFTYGTNYDPTWINAQTGAVNQLGGTDGLVGIYPLTGTVTARLVEPNERKWTLEWQTRSALTQTHLAKTLGEVATPGFAVHNIHANYHFSRYISFRTSLLNVFDLNYTEQTSLAIVNQQGNVTFVKNPGISWYAGLECNF